MTERPIVRPAPVDDDVFDEIVLWPSDDFASESVIVHGLEIAEIDTARRGFESFYRQARPSIGRALALALGDVDLAADATDEALARAYERWSKVSQLERPEGWVYRVGLNWATSVLRRRRNHQRLYIALPDEAPMITDPAVHASIAALDIDHRAVVVCRHLLGWSVSETAAALEIREGTVKSRLHRATRILQARLHHLDPTKQNES
ncbi:MAG: sigma factor-like helix-turn-helix DNA-binding protein [Acidimicrobiales bacterium]